jgi:sterol desaturase/sphingolipid hydroxylase (fatty acid hydroxylase superfamily)
MFEHLIAVFSAPPTVGILALFGVLALAERLRPARPLPAVAGWRAKGTFFFLFGVALSSSAPLAWDAWLAEYRLIDARRLGDAGGAAAGFLVYQLLAYAWHRAMHRFPFLWRWFHQMHHSAERIDVFGAFYFHPLDVIGFSFVTSLSLVGVLGLTAPAALAASLAATFCTLFQHANVRTPRWLGYLMQRPESHGVHHQRGLHACNYGDIPIFDMLFGSFRNPESSEAEAGFYDGASERLIEMLAGRDVGRPAAARASARALQEAL